MGQLVRWFFDNWGQLLQSTGIIMGLAFNALALRADARSRQADTLIRITEAHRSLWMHFEERSELSRVFDSKADVIANPLSAKELRFIQFLINHLIVTYQAQKLGIYQQPKHLKEDMRSFFSLPIVRVAWSKMRMCQDDDFVEFVESALRKPSQRT
jgi:hypothetical protein